MKNRLILISSLYIFLSSCMIEKNCEIERFDLKKMNFLPKDKNLIFVNNSMEYDTLKLIKFDNIYVDKGIDSFFKSVKCKHTITYNYTFGMDNVYLNFTRNENNESLYISSYAIMITLSMDKFKNNSLTSIKSDTVKSDFVYIKKIIFKSFLIYKIETSDGKTWEFLKTVKK